LDEQIEKQKADFGITDANREKLEASYALKMDLFYSQACAIHPLTSFGKQCLKEAVETRKEFESLVGVYTTRITPENISVFLPVLTKDLAEDIITGRREAIGAIRAKGVRTYGAGALAYYVDEDPDGAILRIEWLYVHPDFRGRRIADSLIAEMVYQIQKEPGLSMAASFTVGENWEPVIGNIFSKWKFIFGAQMEGDTIVAVEDITDTTPIEAVVKKYEKNVKPLSEMNSRDISDFIGRVLIKDGYRGYLWRQIKNPGYFDQELSCYTGDRKKPDGVMLVHRTPSGLLRLEYAGFESDDGSSMISMTGHVLYRTLATESTGATIVFPIRMDEFDEMMERIAPKQRSALLVTAVLSSDYLEEDVTGEAVEELLFI
jgi:GNAT superfamily N-acetyltransferase